MPRRRQWSAGELPTNTADLHNFDCEIDVNLGTKDHAGDTGQVKDNLFGPGRNISIFLIFSLCRW